MARIEPTQTMPRTIMPSTGNVFRDLGLTPEEYDKLHAALTRLGAKRLLWTLWALHYDSTPADLANQLLPLLDANDRLLVDEVSAHCVVHRGLIDLKALNAPGIRRQ